MTEERWVAYNPEIGLLWDSAHQNKMGCRQNLRRIFYWDKPDMTYEEIKKEGWTEAFVTASFAV